jgi:hypothetical protein
MNEKENEYYDIITDLALKIQQLKGYQTAYSKPKEGKMVINHNGINYIVEFNCIGKADIEHAFDIFE